MTGCQSEYLQRWTGSLQGTPEDCKGLMEVIRDRLGRPKLACNFFLQCPFAAQKHIVAQPWFPEMAEPEAVDEKNDFSRQLALLIVVAQNLNEEVPEGMVNGTAFPAWAQDGFVAAYKDLNLQQNDQRPPEPAHQKQPEPGKQTTIRIGRKRQYRSGIPVGGREFEPAIGK
jgi:hypothetical protein